MNLVSEKNFLIVRSLSHKDYSYILLIFYSDVVFTQIPDGPLCNNSIKANDILYSKKIIYIYLIMEQFYKCEP